MKSAGKARSNGLYRHIRTSKEIIRNLLNDLYNTLESIYCLAQNLEDQRIAVMTNALGKLLRSSLNDKRDVITVSEDLQVTRDYLSIQQIRYGERLQVEYDFPQDILTCRIPAMTIQPLVENAILHGFRDRSGGEIRISAYRTEEDLILTVRDNGCGVPEEVLAQYRDGAPRPGGHFGLHNVDAILRIRYGPDRGVRFVPVQGEGACIRITLPVFRKGEEPPC